MAKKVGEGDSPTGESKLIGKAELLKILKSHRSIKSQMAELSGELGGKIADAVAKKNFHKGAGAIAAKLEKWVADDQIAKAVAFVQHLDHYIDLLGIREMDMFGKPEGEEEAESEPEKEDVRPRFKRGGKKNGADNVVTLAPQQSS